MILCALAAPISADTVVAARTLPAQTLIMAEDLILRDQNVPGSVETPADIIGMEAKVAIYAGRPIRPRDVGFPAIVERNEIITLHFESGGLVISTEGRALGRAGPGETIRVMNISSRSTVTALIGADGAGYVSH